MKNPLAESPPSLYCPLGAGAQHQFPTGGVAEWSIAAVLKTAEAQVSVGSNPTPSANFSKQNLTFSSCM